MNYECHITTTVHYADYAEVLAEKTGWKTSEIKRDPLLGDGSHFYLTAHDTDYSRLFTKMMDTCKELRVLGAPVLREKIEAIVFDTKTRTAESVSLPHLDDYAVDAFALQMKLRMAEKRSQGYGGWHDPAHLRDVQRDLLWRLKDKLSHLAMKDMLVGAKVTPLVDIANYAMMLTHRIRMGLSNKVSFCKQCGQDDHHCGCEPSYKNRTE